MKTRAGRAGFTIVELLIVIVVIGILAAIVIVAYNGIQTQAKTVAIKTDLESAYKLLSNDNTTNSQFPVTTSAANGGLGLKPSNGATLEYRYDTTVSPPAFCLQESNGAIGYYITSTNNVPTQGTACPVTVSTPLSYSTFPNAPYASTCMGVVFDSSDNLYCSAGSVVYKATRTGNVTILAGVNGTTGFVNGSGSGAQFNSGQGKITVDNSTGNLYVTDYNNNTIRKITPAAVVSTLAGGSAGYADGTGTSARFNTPIGITIDSNNVLYVADANNHRIRKVTLTGSVTTFSGNGAQGAVDGFGSAASFAYPEALAIDSNNNIFMTDSLFSTQVVRKISPGGYVTTNAGSAGNGSGSTNGPGQNAQFNAPWGIAVDSGGVVYVNDYSGVRKLSNF